VTLPAGEAETVTVGVTAPATEEGVLAVKDCQRQSRQKDAGTGQPQHDSPAKCKRMRTTDDIGLVLPVIGKHSAPNTLARQASEIEVRKSTK
jgi:hypothetical protein